MGFGPFGYLIRLEGLLCSSITPTTPPPPLPGAAAAAAPAIAAAALTAAASFFERARDQSAPSTHPFV